MLPSIISQQVADSIRAFLRSAFTFNSPCFEQPGHSMLEQFLAEPDALFKGPYLSAQLPFRKSTLGLDYFPHLSLPFTPHAHQALAFERLSQPRLLSTLVATGTGSGKTECFLYPLLNYCAGTPGQGVKAIIIYPMNALATDQASRFASTVANDPLLKGKVSVGLFVGDEGDHPSTRMTDKQVITCKHTLRDSPPDILLTNYKMLDYLLMRPQDQVLWRFNRPGMLRYLVVDELHTFDGAQGSDLACLIRRLRHHLAVDSGAFACVGTSATVGDDLSLLLGYASTIFDAPFADDAVIREDRYTAAEFLQHAQVEHSSYPSARDALAPAEARGPVDYLNRQIRLWFDDLNLVLPDELDSDEGREARIRLAHALSRHSFLHVLLARLQKGVVSLDRLLQPLQAALGNRAEAEVLVQGFLSLLAVARSEVKESPEQQQKRRQQANPRPVLPFVQLRSQLWLRELRRLVATVEDKPQLVFADDIPANSQVHHLPVLHCRDCHATGWGSYRHGQSNELHTDLDVFYRSFFSQHPGIVLAMPDQGEHSEAGAHQRLCLGCLRLNPAVSTNCSHCGHEESIRVLVPNLTKETQNGLRFNNQCPHCGSKNGLSIMGSRAASLAAVAIHQLYASPFNEHKKLITFSDSVQDAAHRAGFFTARTWPLMVRGQLAQSLRELAEPVPLDAFAEQVCRLAQRQTGTPEAFVARFIAPNMEWLNDYKHLLEQGRLPENSDLPTLVQDRLHWEVFSELGLRAGIGRTLERGGAVAIALPEQMVSMITALHQQLTDELGDVMAGVQVEQVLAMVLGLVYRLRQQGGIMHPAFAGYRSSGGDTFMLTQKGRTSRYLPEMGPRTRLPAYLTTERIKNFERLIGSKSNKSWYQRWLARCLDTGQNSFITATDEAVYRLTLQQLERAGVLARFEAKGSWAYGLQPSALLVSPKAVRLGCSLCTSRITVAEHQQFWWQKAPCISARCQGHYQPLSAETHREQNWQQLEPHRVIGAEHTGLLTRTVREQTEQSFYRGEQPWSVNLLSATPTLEMGIDVGDLSSVLLCSVPPAQANYLQRIGRAGRKDGNAFTLTVAEGNPHDQYFYQDPLEMMQGQVQAPGVFLDAAAILERQLTAFCMDNWVKTGITAHQVGQRVKNMLDELESGRRQGFPWNFLSFVAVASDRLFADFTRVFNTLSDGSVTRLQAFLTGSGPDGLAGRIERQLSLLLKDRKSLKARTDKLKRAIDQLEKRPRDQNYEKDLKDLASEREVLLTLIRDINNKAVLNFFTDEGLLPNYAFPEAGITLRSVLWRKKEAVEQQDGSSSYIHTPYEYERPASAALAELAPLNRFYAGGHKVEIEQIDLKVSEPETWRLCNHCNHSEYIDESGDPHKVCPSCGSPGWADAGQKTTLLKLRQVYARASERASLISDDADSRDPAFFQRQLLVSFAPSAVTHAYHIYNEQVPFGFEFLSKVTLRDINFGQPDDNAGELLVAGEHKYKSGFRVCLGCGMVQKPRQPERHDLSCKYRQEPEQAKFEDYLYLYRQLESEAIRILLPVSQYSSDSTTEASLSAALQLGLRRYFKGSVDHLKGVVYKEPENEGDAYRQYLVIYDTVPGGTGSLKELMAAPEHLLDLLEQALQAINDCECNADPDKDGCYRCVYAYRDRSRMRQVSRNRARQLLTAILDARDCLQAIGSVKDISLEPMMGSELEQKFIERLKMVPGLQLQRDYSQKQGWIVHAGELSWCLQPQVSLGAAQQLALSCRPDYVFYPAEKGATLQPIAVFLDGFVFHKDVVHDDVQKRMAVLGSGRFRVWTLCWNDLVNDDTRHVKDVLGMGHQLPMKDPRRFEAFHPAGFLSLAGAIQGKNSFVLLTDWLQQPELVSERLTRAACAHSWVWLDMATAKDEAKRQKFGYEMQENTPAERLEALLPASPFVFGGLLDSLETSQHLLELAVVMPVSLLLTKYGSVAQAHQQLRHSLQVHLCFDDRNSGEPGYEAALNGFWRMVNIWQSLPGFSFASRLAVKQPMAAEPLPVLPDAAGAPVHETDAGWLQIRELELLPEEALVLLMASGLTVPAVGYPLSNEVGELVAEAELAWEGARLAVFTPDFADAAAVFAAHGWKCLTGEIDKALIEKIKAEIGIKGHE